MPDSHDDSTDHFEEAAGLAPADVQARFGIPPEEVAAFKDIMRIYRKGAVIIREADTERALYLLRVGKVEVTKGAGSSPEPMGEIEALSIFGEMSMINDAPRSATVRALSDEVVVYRIPNPNIHTILTNPLWAELLISRLARNLAQSVDQHLAAANEVARLRAEVQRLKGGA